MIFKSMNVEDLCDELLSILRNFELSKDLEIQMWRLKRINELHGLTFDNVEMRQYVVDAIMNVNSSEMLDKGFEACLRKKIKNFKDVEKIKTRNYKKNENKSS